ncbi:MAG: lantibiotic dehydratase family protein [Flavobacterium nitrogenifigens]|uniref:lantibiotic dehydratase family protein n=1 Tax=Flavobacterium nitrogenifigens TaxID=1617283 RepID=UPI002808EDD0|nr:lantibiotic dehydratase family protein [Flavobacterium nitrogenifigens]MDQ8013225.1 lantibiotic dehydratase family protein [Flavobacterium nitrogenifigens]
MSKENTYKSFPNFVLRAPLLPFNFFEELTSQQDISDYEFKKLFDRAEIKEAVFLATPILFNELEKWLNNKIQDPNKIEKLKYSLLKYVSRMSSRATPFGIFAGCSVGAFDSVTKIKLDNISKNRRHTRLDMNYLVALSQDLAKIENIKKQILFFPNTSIYKSGKHLRYVEFEYVNGIRQHNMMAVDDSVYLQKVLKATEKGMLMKDIIDLLVNDENSFEEVNSFVDELIYSQILISELEPSATGIEFLDHIKSVLLKIENSNDLINQLNYIESSLAEMDNRIENDPKKYIDLSNSVKELGTDFDIKFLFQTDVTLSTTSNLLSNSVADSVKRGMSIFNKLTSPQKNTSLHKFIDAFYERFEDREIPLAKALDVEMGIGYIQNQEVLDSSPLIDDLMFNAKEDLNSYKQIQWSRANSLFHKKIMEAFVNESYNIKLSDKDFEELEENWTDLPDTISTMIEIVIINGEEKIIVSDAGNSSAANLFGRFCHGDTTLKEFTLSITNLEKEMNKTKIIAEINHLPDSRIGNVLLRPHFREFEIPYLAKSTLAIENQLKINDLHISVKKQKDIYLRSVSHNKEILPRLSNSHNYSSSSLPIYHFLCDMQSQNKRAGIGINLGPFANDYEFIPRIEYENLILFPAVWNIKKSGIALFLDKSDAELIESFQLFRNEKKIPQYVMLIESDNQLLVNLENILSLKMFLNTVKNKLSFKIKEFLFNESGIVKNHDDNHYHTNQIILSFYNSSKLKND